MVRYLSQSAYIKNWSLSLSFILKLIKISDFYIILFEFSLDRSNPAGMDASQIHLCMEI